MKNMKVYVTDFAQKHFKEGEVGTYIPDVNSHEEFESTISSIIRNSSPDIHNIHYSTSIGSMKIIDSHLPFCKYMVVSNFTKAISSSQEINKDNYQYLRSGYSSRTIDELPYLSRWFDFPYPNDVPAEYLVLILYSEEQLNKEKTSYRGESEDGDDLWGIVGMQANNHGTIEPMTPYTSVRNALGIKFGGNGEKIDEAYLRSAAEFWEKNAIVKAS